jgi:predicted RNA binding protein YcfA (HicA-like mRNA interferase family)
MKRKALLKHLESHGCEFLREGGKHTVYVNRPKGKAATIPRHTEINDFLAKKICRDLEVPDFK